MFTIPTQYNHLFTILIVDAVLTPHYLLLTLLYLGSKFLDTSLEPGYLLVVLLHLIQVFSFLFLGGQLSF